MIYVILSHYGDSASEVIYSGPYLWEGMKSLSMHSCTNFKIQKWCGGKMTEEISK